MFFLLILLDLIKICYYLIHAISSFILFLFASSLVIALSSSAPLGGRNFPKNNSKKVFSFLLWGKKKFLHKKKFFFFKKIFLHKKNINFHSFEGKKYISTLKNHSFNKFASNNSCLAHISCAYAKR